MEDLLDGLLGNHVWHRMKQTQIMSKLGKRFAEIDGVQITLESQVIHVILTHPLKKQDTVTLMLVNVFKKTKIIMAMIYNGLQQQVQLLARQIAKN